MKSNTQAGETFELPYTTEMNIIQTDIPGALIIEPRIFEDPRGYFFESFSQRDFDANVRTVHFVQDNESKSGYGVLRGLHFQKPPYTQSKLARVIRGTVLDVAVDIRRGSPTFGKHVAVELSGENHRQSQSEGALAWDDPDLGIDWKLPPESVVLSEKDRRHPRLKDAGWLFDYGTDYYSDL